MNTCVLDQTPRQDPVGYAPRTYRAKDLGAISVLTFLGLLSGCSSNPRSPKAALAPPLQRALAVTRFSTSTLDDATADRVLAQASQIISNNACSLSLSRSGAVSTFTAAKGTVITPGDYKNVCAQPGYIHIVNLLHWCDGTTDALGCSDTPGRCMVVVRWTPPASVDPNHVEEGILWAHEYGHTKNLQHRDDDDAVMNPVIGPNHVKINGSECAAYLERAPGPAAAMLRNTAMSVEDFARKIYIHGVPFRAARTYSSKTDVEKLGQILRDPSQEMFWANAATTLGMVATPEASQQLATFVGEGSGVLSPEAYRAKSSAIIAMGYVLGQSGRERPLQYLEQKANPNSWQTVAWSSPFTADPKERNLQLARSAIAALGLSGNYKAKSVLESIKPNHTWVLPARDEISQSLTQALDENRKVRSVGFDKYVIANEELRYKGEVVENSTTPK